MVLVYIIASVVIVSLASLIGIFTLAIKHKKLEKILIYLVSFSAGSLLGGAFIHLLPEAARQLGIGIKWSLLTLFGILIFFTLEKFIHWRHCHLPTNSHHAHHLAPMNLVGDGLHNLIDGMLIAASYLASVPLGIATTFAVLLHEIPQEIGDFGVLLHAGYSKKKALTFNFLSALVSIIGALIVYFIGASAQELVPYLLPIAAGGFIYIASSDLIPELRKVCTPRPSILQFVWLLLGILAMLALVFI